VSANDASLGEGVLRNKVTWVLLRRPEEKSRITDWGGDDGETKGFKEDLTWTKKITRDA